MIDIRQQLNDILFVDPYADADNTLDACIALISQTVSSQQTKLLERLIAQKKSYARLGSSPTEWLAAVPIRAIEAELERLLGRDV